MKRILTLVISAGMIIASYYYKDTLCNLLTDKITSNEKIVINDANEYKKDYDFMYVQNTDNFVPYSYHDLVNIIYTTLNNGWDNFTFYCPEEYSTCIEDLKSICNDNVLLAHISNYVHPYNSFKNFGASLETSTNEITLNIEYLYTDEEIEYINNEIDNIIANNYDGNKSDYDNIKSIHDYIINNTKYDVQAAENITSSNSDSIIYSPSYTAYGLLQNHLATCNGYTDVMAIILSKLGYENYKISVTSSDINYDGNGHVWNAVKVGGIYLHLDLTWDDPVSDTGKDYLFHNYFLVTNEEMQKADSGDVTIVEHNFNNSVYLEFNDSIKSIISS